MPTIPLNALLGLTVDGQVPEKSGFLEILSNFRGIDRRPLDQVLLEDLSAGLKFGSPIPVVEDKVSLTIGARAAGTLAILKHGDHTIAEDDPFGEIAIPADEAWVMVGLSATLEAGLSATVGHLNFGFAKGEDLSVRGYRRFRSTAAGFPEFRDALGKSFAGFHFPASFADLAKLDEDFVLVLSGTGTLTASAGVSLAVPVAALASFSLAAVGSVGVNAGASVDVGASIALSGGYQVRLRRLGSGQVELGVYTFESSEKELTVAARAGVSAGVGRFDLTEQVIRRLNPGSPISEEEFRDALPGENDEAKDRRIERIERKLRAGASRKLEVAVEAAFGELESDEAAWLYQIDPSAQQAATAVEAALAGDFTPLTDADELPKGVEPVSNILTHTEVKKRSLRFHLLGFVDTTSAAKLVSSTEMEVGPDGDITLITDTAGADRISALMAGFGRDRRKVRQMLSENFLLQAVYSVADLRVLPPEFKARHTYFEIHDRTSREEMKNNLDVPRVLSLLSPADASRRLGDRKSFGRTTFYAEAVYKSDALRRMFLDEGGQPRSVAYYEEKGRSALGALLAGDEGQPTRKRVAELGLEGNLLWASMRAQGPTAFATMLSLERDSPELGAVVADYLTIIDWAQAMNLAARALAEVNAALVSDNSVAGVEKAREHLKKRLAGVAAKSREHFGDPLGLVMVYVAAGEDAEVGVRMTGSEIETLALGTAAATAMAAAAGAIT